MATVTLTRHLHAFFPDLSGEAFVVAGATVAEVIAAIEQRAPGFAFYAHLLGALCALSRPRQARSRDTRCPSARTALCPSQRPTGSPPDRTCVPR